MKTRNRITLSVIGIVAILLITIGLSYAYFSANLTGGEEATTITVTGGTMNIVYDGGANINVANIIPSDSPVATKIFTVTGNNTTDIDMGYKISIVIDSNTFSEEALKYKLISANTDNNGTIAPSINELTNIGTGPKTIELGNGTFEVPTGGNKVHTYNLEIHFPNANYNQNEDQGKEFKAHIKTESINYLEYDAEKGVNKPQLATGMVPIKWDGNNWVSTTSNDPDWYDYNNKKWANIATIDQSKAIDYSGNNYYGEIIGAVQTENGLSFDGIDDYVISNDSLINYDFRDKVTFGGEFIYKTDTHWTSLISNAQSSGISIDFARDTNKVACLIHINNEYKRLYSNDPLVEGNYYKLACVYDGSLLKLYINDELDTSLIISGNITISSMKFVVGANPYYDNQIEAYSNLTIKKVFIYNEAVPENQIENIFRKEYTKDLLLYYDFININNIPNNLKMPVENFNTMWVWIPRYAYKITSGYHSNEVGEFDIIFLKDKTLENKEKITIETSGYNVETKNTSQHYFLHPAFHQGGEEILGYWVAKFEASAAEGITNGFTNDGSCPSEQDNVRTKTLKFIPNATSWRCINAKNAYLLSTDMKNKKENYGWDINEIDSHLMTNLEWGAVTYLTQSKYGANAEVWNNSYNQYKTGCSGSGVDARNESICIEYNIENGVKASTTHNITGIYDMSGGSWELVMALYNNIPNTSGFTEMEINSLQSKYINKYNTLNENMLNGIGMDYDTSIYGDGVYEISNSARRYDGNNWIGIHSGWYSDYTNLPSITSSWYARGGGFAHHTDSGIFGFGDHFGGPKSRHSFRTVVFTL